MYIRIKPYLDIVLSIVALLILWPVFLIVAVVLALELRGSPFFVQDRPGYKGEIFSMIKFKTMTDDRNGRGELLPDEDRLTRLGRFVRLLSLDEIPQLVNVLRGEMSLVGPRPLLIEYLPLYDAHQRRRHDVKPGITGWAQVNGRNQATWKRRFDDDVWYVDNVSFGLDAKIILMTIAKVFKRDGVTTIEGTTKSKFRGPESLND